MMQSLGLPASSAKRKPKRLTELLLELLLLIGVGCLNFVLKNFPTNLFSVVPPLGETLSLCCKFWAKLVEWSDPSISILRSSMPSSMIVC